MENPTADDCLALFEKLSKRAQGNLLFFNALKQLANSSPESVKKLNLNEPPDRRGKDNILRLVSYHKILTLEALQGDEFLYEDNIADLEAKYGLKQKIGRNAGMPTKKTHIRIDETRGGRGTIMDAFQSLPGNWSHKCLTWNQITSFLRKYPTWVNQNGITHFLCKKDDNQKIDEDRPQDNLFEVHLYATMQRDPVYATLTCDDLNCATSFPGMRRIVSPSTLDSYLIEDYQRHRPIPD